MKANIYIREVETVFKDSGITDKIKITSSRKAYDLFCDLERTTQEKLIALHLAADNSALCFQVVHIGSINDAYCNPADILRTALLTGAVALVIIHNHPSGRSDPSQADKKITGQIKEACKLFTIKLFDFIIIGKNEYYSMSDAYEI